MGALWASGKKTGWVEDEAKTYGGQFAGTTADPNMVENLQRDRLGLLGGPQKRADLPPWMQQQQDAQRAWADQARAQQQKAFDLANAQAQGGITPQQQQLQQSYDTANGGALGSAAMAGGGARGAAAAQHGAAGILGANQASQFAGMDQQRQGDMLQGQALANQAAGALRGLDQQQLGIQNDYNMSDATDRLGWRDMNDQNSLWAEAQRRKIDAAKQGYNGWANDVALQNYINSSRANQQLAGVGMQMAGNGMAVGSMVSDERTKRAVKRKEGRDMGPSLRARESLRLFAAGEGGDAGDVDMSDTRRRAVDSLRLLAAGEGGDVDETSSDRRTKTKLRDSDEIADALLGSLAKSRATYNYTDPKYEPSTKKGSRYLGIMAQDIEKVPEIGRGIVTERGGVKQIELKPFISALAGALGRVTERMEALEDRHARR